ncbi:peptidoglycan-binding domain-containing protein [Cellulomonas soli]|uniref:Peptidoglycan binding-like domain-containing protein n=1 Tax=Cellulomonas soli TaxID=931535 RepID=A0A512PEH6_9CELL|nr:peptidoglycan-binding domain-containing protein [Cellulomonas soli]NYI58890.1 peptidoglycan hydrolase-like protein with peptidoglycan-binding domain [Cellulomonas soli]GEP69617.1 hypothetical protein CSO01_23320 [Cellulomonas soli]
MRATRAIATSAVAVLLVAAGVAGGMLLHSPDEHVTVDVPQSVLTAPVESRPLTTQYTGTGTFSTGAELTVSVAAPAGMSAVVTAAPVAAGADVQLCDALIEVSGRPVIALGGTLPAYRDLTVGDSGPDVSQLQQALNDCGIKTTVDGTFGTATARGLESLYRRAGYKPVSSATAALTPTTASGDGATTTSTATPTVTTAQVTTAAYQRAAADEADPSATAPPAETAAPTPTPSPAPTAIAARGELLFVPAAARVVSIGAVGAVIDTQPALRLTLTGDRFTIAFSAAQRAAIAAGTPVTISRDAWTITLPLPQLPDQASVDANGTPTYPVALDLPAPVTADFYGQAGQFTITVGQAEPYDLVVPVSAVFEDTTGTMYVQRATPASSAMAAPTTEQVTVSVTASAEGYVALSVLDGHLTIGDEVVIGEQ